MEDILKLINPNETLKAIKDTMPKIIKYLDSLDKERSDFFKKDFRYEEYNDGVFISTIARYYLDTVIKFIEIKETTEDISDKHNRLREILNKSKLEIYQCKLSRLGELEIIKDNKLKDVVIDNILEMKHIVCLVRKECIRNRKNYDK